jgi:hypothetical protein
MFAMVGLITAALGGAAVLADGKPRLTAPGATATAPEAKEEPKRRARPKQAGRCDRCGCKTGSGYRIIKTHKCVSYRELGKRCRPGRCTYEGKAVDRGAPAVEDLCPADAEERALVEPVAPWFCEGLPALPDPR